MGTALEKAMNGEKVADGAVKGALKEAVEKLENMGGRLSKFKERGESTADALISTVEMQGAVMVASMAEGYWGEEKMDVGPVDVRAVGGFGLGGYGLYQAMQGKKGYEHALALGNGLLATVSCRLGRNAGKALREKSEKGNKDAGKASSAPANAAPASAPPAIPDAAGDYGDLVRDIVFTEHETAGRGGGGRKEPARHKPNRFIPAEAA